MSRADLSSSAPQRFPRVEVPPADQVRIRELLVREASTGGRRRAFRRPPARLAIPIVALAVVAAILGSTVVARRLSGSDTPKPATTHDTRPQDGNAQCVSSGTTISRKQGKDLLYLAPTPAGFTSPAYTLENGNSCYMGRDAIASFYRATDGAPTGTFDAAVTVWHLADSPEKLAKWPNVSWRVSSQTGLPTRKAVPVTVGGRPGELTGHRLLNWQASDGQYWSMTGSGLTGDQLIAIGAALELKGTTVSWPEAGAKGFTRLDVPAQPRIKYSRDMFFEVEYKKKNCRCTLHLVVIPQAEQDQHPWQAQLGQVGLPARLVTVDGRPGLLTEHGEVQAPGNKTGHELRTLTADGTNLWVIENITGKRTDLVAWAQGIKKVSPDDPRLARLNPYK
jgi:hypothetical protein